MDEWKQLIAAGNYQYSAENYQSALAMYDKSLNCILKDFSQQLELDPHGAIAAVLISYFNLADTYADQSKFEQAAEQFEQAYRFVLGLVASTFVTEEISLALVKSVSRLDLEWTDFIKRAAKQLPAEHLQLYASAKRILAGKGDQTLTLH